MPKTLITHLRPHLDDICAFWLITRYFPGFQDAHFDFVPTDPKGGGVQDDENTVCVGVGRGRFDEHKGDIGECSTSLVYKELLRIAPPATAEQAALQPIVDWVLDIDLGNKVGEVGRAFSLSAALDGFFETHERDSFALTDFGFTLLDALVQVQRGEVQRGEIWKHRIEFETPWGKGVGMESALRGMDAYAYERGFAVVALVNPERTYHAIRADAHSDSDLTTAYDMVRAREPQASWYFHHSKRMLICGGTGFTAATTPSSLSLKALIALIKTE